MYKTVLYCKHPQPKHELTLSSVVSSQHSCDCEPVCVCAHAIEEAYPHQWLTPHLSLSSLQLRLQSPDRLLEVGGVRPPTVWEGQRIMDPERKECFLVRKKVMLSSLTCQTPHCM